jgi:GNAT superfamily N-acetyltransferase
MGEPALKKGAWAEIQRESLAEVRSSGAIVEELLVRHWQEISHFQDIPVEVNWPFYEQAEALDKLRTFTVRVEGELAGYAVYMVNRNPHYMSSLQSVQDVLYLAPEFRGGTRGYRLIKAADEALADEGVQCVYQHQKIAHPALGRLLQKLGYEPVEIIWVKRLDKAA